MMPLIVFVFGFVMGMIVVGLLFSFNKNEQSCGVMRSNVRQNQALTNPLLECDSNHLYITKTLAPFKSEINKLILKYTQDPRISHVSYYFREFNNGTWFGINEEEKFNPASLLKIAVMMAVFKQAEYDPKILTETELPYITRELALQNIPVDNDLVSGASYSAERLIEQMIVESDNNALYALEPLVMDKEYEQEIHNLIGLEYTVDRDSLITVAQYSVLFRLLYNASYLNRTYSEKALQFLSRTKFSDGIRAGVGEDVVVAHKYGERGDGYDGFQLHDCGIGYYPNHDYLVCIMTRGTDLDYLKTVISGLAAETHQQVSAQASEAVQIK